MYPPNTHAAPSSSAVCIEPVNTLGEGRLGPTYAKPQQRLFDPRSEGDYPAIVSYGGQGQQQILPDEEQRTVFETSANVSPPGRTIIDVTEGLRDLIPFTRLDN